MKPATDFKHNCCLRCVKGCIDYAQEDPVRTESAVKDFAIKDFTVIRLRRHIDERAASEAINRC